MIIERKAEVRKLKSFYKMERKYGKYAVRNLSAYIAGCFVISYILALLLPNVYQYMLFSPIDIFYGHQYWRFFTWIFTTPGGFDIFSLIMIFFYYSIGTSIERGIGTFRYNLYVFGSLTLITLGQLVTWLIMYFALDTKAFLLKALAADGMAGASLMTYYMTTSVFLGFALLYQEAMVLLFFVIPFKVKWMAYIDGFFLLYYFIKIDAIASRITIVAIVINFLIYVLMLRSAAGKRRPTQAQLKHRRMYRDTMRRNGAGNSKVVEFNPSGAKSQPTSITRHKCAVCGRTEKDGMELEFRFCSKCNGNYEYCQDHLYTHEHVK